MKCKDCVYYWQDKEDLYPICHCRDGWLAPCEYDDYDDEY